MAELRILLNGVEATQSQADGFCDYNLQFNAIQNIINNATTEELEGLFETFDLSKKTPAQAAAIIQCIADNLGEPNATTILNKFNMNNLTETQCQNIATCLASNPNAVTILENALGPFPACLVPIAGTNEIRLVDRQGNPLPDCPPVDLTPYLDDTNLARIINGNLTVENGVATLTITRDDGSTFDIDLTALIDELVGPLIVQQPLTTEPTETGNTTNLNSFVTGPSGICYFIDAAGNSKVINNPNVTIDPEDVISTEAGNTLVEGDDGNLFAMPYVGKKCYENTPPRASSQIFQDPTRAGNTVLTEPLRLVLVPNDTWIVNTTLFQGSGVVGDTLTITGPGVNVTGSAVTSVSGNTTWDWSTEPLRLIAGEEYVFVFPDSVGRNLAYSNSVNANWTQGNFPQFVEGTVNPLSIFTGVIVTDTACGSLYSDGETTKEIFVLNGDASTLTESLTGPFWNEVDCNITVDAQLTTMQDILTELSSQDEFITVAVGCAAVGGAGTAPNGTSNPVVLTNGAELYYGDGVAFQNIQNGVQILTTAGQKSGYLQLGGPVENLVVRFYDLDGPSEWIGQFTVDGVAVTPTLGNGAVVNTSGPNRWNTGNNSSGEFIFAGPVQRLEWEMEANAGFGFTSMDSDTGEAQTYTTQNTRTLEEALRFRDSDALVPNGAEVLCSIDVSQLPPQSLANTSGSVTNNNITDVTTDNGVTVPIGTPYITFPDGTTWASDSGSPITLEDNTLADYQALDADVVDINTRQTSALSLREVLRVHNGGSTEVGVGADGSQQTNGVMVGNSVGSGSTGNANIMIGSGNTGDSANYSFSTAIGVGAGRETVSGGPYNLYIHGNSGRNSALANSMVVGLGAGRNTGTAAVPVNNLLALGNSAGRDSEGDNNTFIGFNAGNSATGGENKVGIGLAAMRSNTGTGGIGIGFDVGNTSTTSNFVSIGQQAGAVADESINIGTAAGAATSLTAGDVAIGSNALNGADVAGFNSVAIGFNAGQNAGPEGSGKGAAVFIGGSAGVGATGFGHVAIGSSAGNDAQGQSIISIGRLAGSGSFAGHLIAIGQGTGVDATGGDLIAIGRSSLAGNTGSRVLALGTAAGANNTQSQRVIIGHFELPRFAGEAAAAAVLPAAPAAGDPNTGSIYVYWDTTDNTLKVRPA